MRITITRALAQVKSLDKRIDKKIEDFTAVTYVKNSSEVVQDGRYTRQEFNAAQQAELQSIQDLIALRKELKSKIVASNAKTLVTIGGEQYTVADAIERKNSIELDQHLLSRLKARINVSRSFINRKNEAVEENALSIIQSLAGKDKAVKVEDNKLAQDYLKENSYSLIDPININTLIDNLEREIDLFEANVDFALSESNAITEIEVQGKLEI